MTIEELTQILQRERQTTKLQPLQYNFFEELQDLLIELDSVFIQKEDNFELKAVKTKLVGLLHRREGKIMQSAVTHQKTPEYLTDAERELWQRIEQAVADYEKTMKEVLI